MTDLIMLVMNQGGEDKLLASKFPWARRIGGGWPVGRTATAQTDAQMHAEILSWSRSQGCLPVLPGRATLREDLDDNATLYGKRLETGTSLPTEGRTQIGCSLDRSPGQAIGARALEVQSGDGSNFAAFARLPAVPGLPGCRGRRPRGHPAATPPHKERKGQYEDHRYVLTVCAFAAAQSSQAPNPLQRPPKMRPGWPGPCHLPHHVVERTTKAINYNHRSGSTKIDFRGTSLLPEAGRGHRAEQAGRHQYRRRMEKLQPATKVGPEY